MEFAKASDRTVVVVIGPSGGRPDFARIAQTSQYRYVVGPHADLSMAEHPDVATLAAAAVYYRGFADVAIGSMIAH